MIFLFRSGTVREKLTLILRATKTHAQNLAKYATVYKLTMLALKHAGTEPGKEGRYDTFFAGLLGGYLVFGRRSAKGHVSSVSKQIVIFGRSPSSISRIQCSAEGWTDELMCSVCESVSVPGAIVDSA